MWGRKKKAAEPVVPDDIAEARDMRDSATQEHREAVRQGFQISQLTSYLNDRRALNHFGESIEISFTRRGHA